MDGDRIDSLTRWLAWAATRRRFAGTLIGGGATVAWIKRAMADDDPRLVVLAPPSTGPKLNGIGVTGITATSATIVWTTDEAGDSTVEYGVSADLGQAVTSPDPVTDHQVTLTDLDPATEYHYRVSSRNANGTHATRQDRTFSTATEALAVSPEAITRLALAALFAGDFDAFAATFLPGSAPADWNDFWEHGQYSSSVHDFTTCAGIDYGLGSWAADGCRPSVHSTDVNVIAYFSPFCGEAGNNGVGSLIVATHRVGDGWYLVGLVGINGSSPEFGEPCIDTGDPSSGGICDADHVNCDDLCVDITTDSDHCGGCDQPCHGVPGAQDAGGCQCARSLAGAAACIHNVIGGCDDSPACAGDEECGADEVCVTTYLPCATGLCVRICS